ncbi:unnamed protein product, partial [Staurois parvus]
SVTIVTTAIEKYCEICDWSQLVTWYKADVNSLVPCDLCDHSQISQVVSNDVRKRHLVYYYSEVPYSDW